MHWIEACAGHRSGLELVAQNKIFVLTWNQTQVLHCNQPCYWSTQLIMFMLEIGTEHLQTNSAWTFSCLFPNEERIYKNAFLFSYVTLRKEFLRNMMDWYFDSIMRMLPQNRHSATPVFTFCIWQSRSAMTICQRVHLQPQNLRTFKNMAYFYFNLHFRFPHL